MSEPTTIMMVHLCPTGSEGASYAMFTTVHNAAYTLSSAISTQMLGIFDVSKDTLIDGDLSGMTKLTILTTAIQVSGVLFVKLLPHSKEDLTILHQNGSKTGGRVLTSIYMNASNVYTRRLLLMSSRPERAMPPGTRQECNLKFDRNSRIRRDSIKDSILLIGLAYCIDTSMHVSHIVASPIREKTFTSLTTMHSALILEKVTKQKCNRTY
eukprot:scaffold85141_cov51-Attheya_sp.AAC.2